MKFFENFDLLLEAIKLIITLIMKNTQVKLIKAIYFSLHKLVNINMFYGKCIMNKINQYTIYISDIMFVGYFIKKQIFVSVSPSISVNTFEGQR